MFVLLLLLLLWFRLIRLISIVVSCLFCSFHLLTITIVVLSVARTCHFYHSCHCYSFLFALITLGEQDVNDCWEVVKKTVENNKSIDKTKLFLLGGSHGGFLVGHLSSSPPPSFLIRAACMRNPGINQKNEK